MSTDQKKFKKETPVLCLVLLGMCPNVTQSVVSAFQEIHNPGIM